MVLRMVDTGSCAQCLSSTCYKQHCLSYAIMFNKPVLVLISNEIIEDNNILLQESNHLSSILGCPTINIDKIDEKLLSNFSINIDKYLAYKNKYLSSRLDNKTNGEIIIEDVIN